MKKPQPLIIGNWKMNPASSREVVTLTKEYVRLAKKSHHALVAVAPPAIYFPIVGPIVKKSTLMLASQDVSDVAAGAATGDISLAMLREYDGVFSLIGHSECRARGASDQLIAHKIAYASKQKQSVVLCVGETERDPQGEYFTVVEKQISSALATLSGRQLSFITMAYEPVWSIGTGRTPTVDDIHEMRLFINKIITELFGRAAAAKMKVIYGGSVNAKNARELWQKGGIDGFLVGGASLKAEEFFTIVKSTSEYVA